MRAQHFCLASVYIFFSKCNIILYCENTISDNFFCTHPKPIQLRDRPFNLKWGAWFFAKKNDLMLNFENKNTLAGMGTEKNNLRQYFHNIK
jgi:hypothetical protein